MVEESIVFNYKVIILVQIKNMKNNKILLIKVEEVFFLDVDGIQDY